MTSSQAFLAALRREIETHPAVNHIFLNRCATSPFSRQDYKIFAENHYPLVSVFTSYLEKLLCRAPSSEAKMWLAKVLVDEYGEGSRGEDHPTLYGHFLRATGGTLESADRIPLPAYRFIVAHRRIVEREPFLVGLGAVGPGHEWAIPKMFGAVIPGLRRAGLSEDDIHYFTLHVEQDVDHGTWLEEALRRFGDSPQAQAQIRRGALESLEARGAFWTGVQSAVVRYRQPRAARPDGPRPRSIPHEIALTAWDGLEIAQRLSASVARLRERARPTLARVLSDTRR